MKHSRVDLDDPAGLRRLDADGMLDRLHEFPEECGRALKMAGAFALPDRLRNAERIVILGMGGSAIGGDLVASLAEPEARVPIHVYRGYQLPAYVDTKTLVIASSYSGNTEETLACFREGMARGALSFAITTGGKLKDMASASGVPTFVYDYKSPPRAALPYGFVTLLCFLRRLGFLQSVGTGMETIPAFLEAYAKTIDELSVERQNAAKQLARFLSRRVAVIYGAEMLSEVAHRWKTQINENSKGWAVYETIPEMNHNSVVGYQFPSDMKEHLSVIILESPLLSTRIGVRLRVVKELLNAAGIPNRSVAGAGDNSIDQVMSLVLLGDYVSYYLAILNGTEPGPVAAIDYLKTELAKVSV